MAVELTEWTGAESFAGYWDYCLRDSRRGGEGGESTEVEISEEGGRGDIERIVRVKCNGGSEKGS